MLGHDRRAWGVRYDSVMATDKRERQRANREEKKAAQAKAERRKRAFERIRRWAIYAILIAAALLAFTLLTR